MLRCVLLVAASLAPQLATAADLPRVRVHRHVVHVERRVERSRYISCTTTSFVLFSVANCGGGFDPLSVAGM
jgi:hypothetical protein